MNKQSTFISTLFISLIIFITIRVPAWALVELEYKKGNAPAVMPEANPQAMEQANRVVARNNALIADAEQPLNVIPQPQEQKKLRQWINDIVDKKMTKRISAKAFPNSDPITSKELMGKSNTPLEKKLLRDALEFILQNAPDKIKKWMAYVDYIVITDFPQEDQTKVGLATTINGLGIILVDREFLNIFPDRLGETRVTLLARTLVHEARHLWQDHFYTHVKRDPLWLEKDARIAEDKFKEIWKRLDEIRQQALEHKTQKAKNKREED